jgi:flavodoxin
MNYKVVYFTRTGNSERVAKKIASKLSCETIQVTDNMDWNGKVGFLKGGYYASKNKDVEIKTSKQIDDYDELIVVSPLWAGTVAPAIRVFLKSIPHNKVNLVITSSGSKINDRSDYKSVSDIVKNKHHEDEIIDILVNGMLR